MTTKPFVNTAYDYARGTWIAWEAETGTRRKPVAEADSHRSLVRNLARLGYHAMRYVAEQDWS